MIWRRNEFGSLDKAKVLGNPYHFRFFFSKFEFKTKFEFDKKLRLREHLNTNHEPSP